MDTELRKRIEEAAEKIGVEEFNNLLYGGCSRTEASLCKESAEANFKKGFEYGVREAVRLHELFAKSKQLPPYFHIAFGEFMTKLWEKKK